MTVYNKVTKLTLLRKVEYMNRVKSWHNTKNIMFVSLLALLLVAFFNSPAQAGDPGGSYLPSEDVCFMFGTPPITSGGCNLKWNKENEFDEPNAETPWFAEVPIYSTEAVKTVTLPSAGVHYVPPGMKPADLDIKQQQYCLVLFGSTYPTPPWNSGIKWLSISSPVRYYTDGYNPPSDPGPKTVNLSKYGWSAAGGTWADPGRVRAYWFGRCPNSPLRPGNTV